MEQQGGGEVFQIAIDEAWPGLFLVWLIFYLPVAVVVGGPLIWMFRHRARWRKLDLLVLFIPFYVWGFALLANADNKLWGNIFTEPVIIAVLLSIYLIMRVRLLNLFQPTVLIVTGTALLSLASGLVWLLMPAIKLRSGSL